MSSDKILLKNVRVSYPSLFRKSIMKGETDQSKAQYQCTFILDKEEHATSIKRLQREIQKTLEEKFGKGKAPRKYKCCLADGDLEDAEELEGKYRLRTASATVRPNVVNKDMSPITEEDDIIYAGCYVHATVSLWAYDHPKGGKGVSANIRAVMFHKDGEPFGAGPVDVEDEFGDLTEEDLEGDDFLD